MSEIVKQLQKISENDALRDFLKLKNSTDTRHSALVGNKAMNYFFKEAIINTKGRTGKSFVEFLADEEELAKPYNQKIIENNLKDKKNITMAKYHAFMVYYGSICGFRPNIARLLYQKYNATCVLDPCAGFGGRCLGAMSLGIDYVGYDTNTTLAPAYNAMLTTFPHDGKIEIHYEDSARADFSRYNYDFVLTSPPYIKNKKFLETYVGMPQTCENFAETFLKPMILNAWANLKPGGYMALNVRTNMYDWIVEYMGECTEKIPLFLRKRMQGVDAYSEYIYVWAKV